MLARSAPLAPAFALAAALALLLAGTAPVGAQPGPNQPAPPSQPTPTTPPAAAPAPAPAPKDSAKSDLLVGETVDLAAQPALTYLGETDWDDAEKALSDAINRLYVAAAKAKLEIAGPPMIEYLDTSGVDFRFTGFLPLKAAPTAALPDPIKAGTTPTGAAQRFVHQGSYEDLEDVYARIDNQLAADGKTMKRVIEEYVSDPTATAPEQMVTNIYVFTE